MKNKLIFLIVMILIEGCSIHPAQTTEHAVTGSIASKLLLRGSLTFIKVTNLKVKKINKLLVVEAEVFNTENFDDTLYYRFKWYDQKGFEVSGEEVWKFIPLRGAQIQNITGIATSMNAIDFKLELQSPSNMGN